MQPKPENPTREVNTQESEDKKKYLLAFLEDAKGFSNVMGDTLKDLKVITQPGLNPVQGTGDEVLGGDSQPLKQDLGPLENGDPKGESSKLMNLLSNKKYL